MISLFKKMASRLPAGLRESLQKHWHTLRYRSGRFVHNEPEFALLNGWVSAGDWVLDVGANIGIFSARLSELVKENGRVLAFEPVPATFRLLVHNSRLFPYANVTALNFALSGTPALIGMSIPATSTGLPALARASLVDSGGQMQVLCLPFGETPLPHAVRFIKIDVEGHEAQVLKGIWPIIERDRPRLLIEGFDEAIHDSLRPLGYQRQLIEGSPNAIFHPHGDNHR